MASNVLDIMSPLSSQSCWAPPNHGLSQFKIICWPCQFFASLWHFWPCKFFSQWGYLFCIKQFDTKTEIDQASMKKNTFDLAVDAWHIPCVPGGNLPNSSTTQLNRPKLVPISWSETQLTSLFYNKKMQRFSQKFGNWQKHNFCC